jgi:hypothetical protein
LKAGEWAIDSEYSSGLMKAEEKVASWESQTASTKAEVRVATRAERKESSWRRAERRESMMASGRHSVSN